MKIGAFFDLDGTLLPEPSLERQFVQFLRSKGTLGLSHLTRWLARLCLDLGRHPLSAFACNKAYLGGVPCALMEEWLACLKQQPFPYFPEALRRLEGHAVQRHRIFLVSGTIEPLAEAVARRLPVSTTVCANRLESADGRWTGRLAGELIWGPLKARALEQFAKQQDVDLEHSFAYGNDYADHWMLDRVGFPFAVNPSPCLRWLANRRGWPVLERCRCASSKPEVREAQPTRYEKTVRSSMVTR